MKTAHKKSAHAKRRYQADPSSMYRVFSRVQPLVEEEIEVVTKPVTEAFDRMKSGQGRHEDFDTLSSAMNICMVRGEEIDPLCVETAKRAMDALMRSFYREKMTGRWGFDGPALQDIPLAIDLYNQMVELSTPIQLKSAMLETVNRMNRGLTL